MKPIAVLPIRFTPSELDLILQLAHARRCSPSDQARELMRLLPLHEQQACERREQRPDPHLVGR